MAGLHRHGLSVGSALAVPALTLLSPGWLSLDGVSPSWVVLWLLPYICLIRFILRAPLGLLKPFRRK